MDAAVLQQNITRDGRVSVYGIPFDSDKADIKPESKAALAEIARLLNNLPDLRIFVVGHTDMTGDVTRNQSLSEARAEAVVRALVAEHGIAQYRLEAFGVGPLAPVATNSTEQGRVRNRRMELVAR
jgi:outer membrane protein OmpA-like peptidoglycan-associated protein